jgi:hypothetical protein
MAGWAGEDYEESGARPVSSAGAMSLDGRGRELILEDSDRIASIHTDTVGPSKILAMSAIRFKMRANLSRLMGLDWAGMSL